MAKAYDSNVTPVVAPISTGGYKRLPKYVIALDASGQRYDYKVVISPIGSIGVRAMPQASASTTKPVVVALHPDLLFARQARLLSSDPADVEMQAQDLFPFDPSQTRYAVSNIHAKQANFYAMPPETYQKVMGLGVNMLSILVAKTDNQSIEDALHDRFKLGPIADMAAPAQALIPPAVTVFLKLILALFVMWLLMEWGTGQYRQARLDQLAEELQTAESTLGQIEERHRNLKVMRTHLSALDEFQDPAYNRTFEKLFTILNQVPAGDLVERISFESGKIIVEGLSANPRAWLAGSIQPDNLEVQDLPAKDLFEAEFIVE